MFEVHLLEPDPSLQLAPELLPIFWFLRIGHYTSDKLDELLTWHGIPENDKEILLSDYQEILRTFGDQTRRSGAPSVDHPVAAMLILLIVFKVTKLSMLRAALYHDVLEDFRRRKDVGDNVWTRKRLERVAGKEVVKIVSRLTKRVESPKLSKEQVQELYREQMVGASAEELLVKDADWFHNLATPWKIDDKGHLVAKAYETVNHFIPLTRYKKTAKHRQMAKYLSIQTKHIIDIFGLDVRAGV